MPLKKNVYSTYGTLCFVKHKLYQGGCSAVHVIHSIDFLA